MPNAPDTRHLGMEPLFRVDDRVVYIATHYWKQGGMWAYLEGRVGYIVKVSPSTQLYNYVTNSNSREHPFKYGVRFEGENRDLTPAAENIQPAPLDPEWEV